MSRSDSNVTPNAVLQASKVWSLKLTNFRVPVSQSAWFFRLRIGQKLTKKHVRPRKENKTYAVQESGR
jgi:hypothetical protein